MRAQDDLDTPAARAISVSDDPERCMRSISRRSQTTLGLPPTRPFDLATFRRKSRFSGRIWDSREVQKCRKDVQKKSGILSGEGSTDIDQVIADHAESYPSLHPGVSFVTASTQSVPAFEYADSPFATGSPLLPFAEPALLLMSAPFRAPGGMIGNGKTLDPHALNLGFSLRGVESGVAGDHGGSPVSTTVVAR